MLRLIRFNFDCGYSGCLNGIFILDEAGWVILDNIVQNRLEICFGEVLGKHSEVCGPIEPNDFEVVTEDQEFCRKFQELQCDSGHNPLDYLEASGLLSKFQINEE